MLTKQDFIYSLDRVGHLINAEEAIKGDKYYCPCCGDIMIPRQGKIRRWHFAHKSGSHNCSYESYLHKIAKKRIKECFDTSFHFWIKINQHAVCNMGKCPIGKYQLCYWNKISCYDIRKYYDKCEEEVTIGAFRADLLLTNNKNIHPILIEICVSHESSNKKIGSDYRIIEIFIESENDIDFITSNAMFCESGISGNGLVKTIFYNFKRTNHITPEPNLLLDKYLFWIDSDRKLHLKNRRLPKCTSLNHTDIENSLFRIESSENIELLFALHELSRSGIGIKYCHMCKYYHLNGNDECDRYKYNRAKHDLRLKAMECPYFCEIDYSGEIRNKEFRITINTD